MTSYIILEKNIIKFGRDIVQNNLFDAANFPLIFLHHFPPQSVRTNSTKKKMKMNQPRASYSTWLTRLW